MPNTTVPAAATGLPIDHTPRSNLGEKTRATAAHADEFLALMDQKRHIDRRLDELVPILDGMLGLKGPRPRGTLPQSGLSLAVARPGAVLYKGGRRHA